MSGMRWSAADIESARNRLRAQSGSSIQRGETPSPSRPTKYSAVRTQVGERSFASKAEAERYRQLKLLESAGSISGLELQPRFPLRVAGVLVTTYVGDFRFMDSAGKEVVEDVKGFKTPEYRIKKKLYNALHPNVPITEISRRR